MEDKNRGILFEILKDMDDFAQMKGIDYPPIYLLGGSGCIIGKYLDRATTDLDIHDIKYDANMCRLLRNLEKYDFLDFHLTTIPDNFKQRAKKIEMLKNVFVLSLEDIILSKIGRYSPVDVEDISILLKRANRSLLVMLIDKVLNRNDISKRVKEAFLMNLKLFREQFDI